MQSEEVQAALRPLVERMKKETFVPGYNATDAEALGVAVSKFFKWDGFEVLRTAQAALEDANFHAESAAVGKMAERG